MAQYPSNVYNSTDSLTNLINVSVNGNSLSILSDNYILPSPVLYKLNTNLPNTLIYVLSMLIGLLQTSVQVTVSINQLDEIVPVVMLNNYYYLQGPLSFPALSVTLNNGQLSAQLNPSGINTQLYQGNSFNLTGNVLTASTALSSVQAGTTSVSGVSSTSSTTTSTTSSTSS